MQININTDHTIDRNRGLDDHVLKEVHNALDRFGDHISRVEVHLSDKVKEKSVDGENRCTMEARVTGYQPIVVHQHSIALHLAISEAAAKLARAIDSALGRLHDKKMSEPPLKHLSGEAEE